MQVDAADLLDEVLAETVTDRADLTAVALRARIVTEA